MDGNGRWAARRGLPRFEGHRRGVEALRRAVRAAGDLGISYLTIYSFSSENWRRPEAEVSDLMNLLRRFVRDDLDQLNKSGVRIKVIGERETLAADIRALLHEAENLTQQNSKLVLQIAFNYGSRQEIADAAKRMAVDVAEGRVSAEAITAETLEGYLDTAGVPDPDLVIRTSGEQRLSNFLLWQSAYAEFVFLPIHWPEFDRSSFEAAIAQYASRDRRFGGVSGKEQPA
jgi:undecaprenyl diphosphate synthase